MTIPSGMSMINGAALRQSIIANCGRGVRLQIIGDQTQDPQQMSKVSAMFSSGTLWGDRVRFTGLFQNATTRNPAFWTQTYLRMGDAHSAVNDYGIAENALGSGPYRRLFDLTVYSVIDRSWVANSSELLRQLAHCVRPSMPSRALHAREALRRIPLFVRKAPAFTWAANAREALLGNGPKRVRTVYVSPLDGATNAITGLVTEAGWGQGGWKDITPHEHKVHASAQIHLGTGGTPLAGPWLDIGPAPEPNDRGGGHTCIDAKVAKPNSLFGHHGIVIINTTDGCLDESGLWFMGRVGKSNNYSAATFARKTWNDDEHGVDWDYVRRVYDQIAIGYPNLVMCFVGASDMVGPTATSPAEFGENVQSMMDRLQETYGRECRTCLVLPWQLPRLLDEGASRILSYYGESEMTKELADRYHREFYEAAAARIADDPHRSVLSVAEGMNYAIPEGLSRGGVSKGLSFASEDRNHDANISAMWDVIYRAIDAA